MTAVPLHRNRDLLLLQAGRLLSSAGSQFTSIAYPLLAGLLLEASERAAVAAFAASGLLLACGHPQPGHPGRPQPGRARRPGPRTPA